MLIPLDRDVLNGHRYRISLQLHLEVEDRFLRFQIAGQCLREIVVWQIFGVIGWSSAIGLARNSRIFYRVTSLSIGGAKPGRCATPIADLQWAGHMLALDGV